MNYQFVLNMRQELGISVRVVVKVLESYKNVTNVVNKYHSVGINKKSIKLRPITSLISMEV